MPWNRRLCGHGSRWIEASRRTALWISPLLTALLFLLGVGVWTRHDRQAQRELMQATRALEAQLRHRLEGETALLQALAARLPAPDPASGNALLREQSELSAGLTRLWRSVVWLDGQMRVVGTRERAPVSQAGEPLELAYGQGLTLHLSVFVDGRSPAGGQLVARYAPSDLLANEEFAWLSAKYDVELLTGLEQTIASTATEQPEDARGERYAMPFGPVPDTVLRLRLRDPAKPWWERTSPSLLIAGFVLLIAVASALLQRQVARVTRVEAELRSEAAWRSAMQDSAQVGLRARDASGKILYVNKTFSDLVGHSVESLIGALPPMPFWPAQALAEISARDQRNLRGLSPREGYQTRWQHKSGRMLDVMVLESPLLDAGGSQIGWMGSIVDLTEQRRLEEIAARHKETLARHGRVALLGRFAEYIAHQINQPLSAIASYNAGVLTALRREPHADAELLDALGELGRQVAQAGRIVHGLRERVGGRPPAREACDLNAVVREALELLKREPRMRALQLEIVLEPGLPCFSGCRIEIEQVVMNLVINALDAVTSAAGERRIAISTARHEGHALSFRVSDSGPGLQGRDLELLCASLFSSKPDGMGMGLTICRSILEAHEGTLTAGAGHLGGACFQFSLPVSERAAQRGSA